MESNSMIMPKRCVTLSSEEMYQEGGAVSTFYKTAKEASTYLVGKAAIYAGAGLGASGFTIASAATIAGALGFGSYAAMSYKMAEHYTAAYNSAQSILANKGNVRCKIQETIMLGLYVSNVTCVRA